MGWLNSDRRRGDVDDPVDTAASADLGADPIDRAPLAWPEHTQRVPGRWWVRLRRSQRPPASRVAWHQGTSLATRAVHLALVAALVSGPAALAVAAVGWGGNGLPTPTASTSPGAGTLEASRASAAGERLVLTWLTGTQADEAVLQAQLMTALPPTFALPDTKPAALDQVWVDRAEEVSPGRWQVVVGARGGAAGAQSFFTVPVLVDAAGAAALTLPARTNPPASPDTQLAPAQGLTSVTAEDPVYQTASGYLAAFLAGQGELDRWVAPGVNATPVQPRPCRTVKLDDVLTAVDEVPTPDRNGLQLAVIATATCRATAGSPTVSQYPLVLQVRDGRWEVAADNPGLATSPDPTSSSSTTPAPLTSPTASPSDQPR